MIWNLFCFHILEEPPVLLCITYRNHSFKTFRCCGSSDSLPFPLSTSCSHSLVSCSLSLSLSLTLLRFACESVCTKQMNVFMLATCQWFWEVISSNTAVLLFIFVTLCSLPYLKQAVVYGENPFVYLWGVHKNLLPPCSFSIPFHFQAEEVMWIQSYFPLDD